jgi:hypothetical protein
MRREPDSVFTLRTIKLGLALLEMVMTMRVSQNLDDRGQQTVSRRQKAADCDRGISPTTNTPPLT